MKKGYFTYIIIFALLMLSLSGLASAGEDWFVNDSASLLPKFFEGVYAIGGQGTALLSADQAYALSSGGLQPLGTANSSGGGGLRYDNGSISIRSTLVRVGLYYYYSSARDSSLSTATLENLIGSGFSFGYYDDAENYYELGTTTARRITLRPGGGSAIEISADGSNELLYTAESSGKDSYLIVRPIGDGGSAVTAFSGYRYFGSFGFAVLGSGKLTAINILDIEPYIMGVCACEMSESWPLEALKAQAVAARTFAQKMLRNSVYYYTCGFDLTADTYCQAYRGYGAVGSNIESAVKGTENQYLTYNGALAEALYSAADGGATEKNQNVFGNNSHPYLVGVIDPFEAAANRENPYAAWSVVLTPTQLGSKLGIGPVREVTAETSETGNVIRLDLVSTSGQTATVIRDNCRTAIGMKSIHYTVTKDAGGNFVFEGSGCGHNLGMSQWGAYAMAKYYEKDYRDILGFYYTGVGLSYGVTP